MYRKTDIPEELKFPGWQKYKNINGETSLLLWKEYRKT